MTDIMLEMPLYHGSACACAICTAARDALEEIEYLHNELETRDHKIMCLKAEVSASHAANAFLNRENDILEEGLREARQQLLELQQHIDAIPPQEVK